MQVERNFPTLSSLIERLHNASPRNVAWWLRKRPCVGLTVEWAGFSNIDFWLIFTCLNFPRWRSSRSVVSSPLVGPTNSAVSSPSYGQSQVQSKCYMILQSWDTTSPMHPIWLPTRGRMNFISTRSMIVAHLRRTTGSHDPILLNHKPISRFDIRTRTPIPKGTKIWRAHDHPRQRQIPIRNHKTRAIDSYSQGNEQLHQPGWRQLSTKNYSYWMMRCRRWEWGNISGTFSDVLLEFGYVFINNLLLE